MARASACADPGAKSRNSDGSMSSSSSTAGVPRGVAQHVDAGVERPPEALLDVGVHAQRERDGVGRRLVDGAHLLLAKQAVRGRQVEREQRPLAHRVRQRAVEEDERRLGLGAVDRVEVGLQEHVVAAGVQRRGVLARGRRGGHRRTPRRRASPAATAGLRTKRPAGGRNGAPGATLLGRDRGDAGPREVEEVALVGVPGDDVGRVEQARADASRAHSRKRSGMNV